MAAMLCAGCSGGGGSALETCPLQPQIMLGGYSIVTSAGLQPNPSLPAGEYSTAATDLGFTTTDSGTVVNGVIVLHGTDGTTIDASSFVAEFVVPDGTGPTVYTGYSAGISGLESNVTYSVVLTAVTYGHGCRGSDETTGSFTTN